MEVYTYKEKLQTCLDMDRNRVVIVLIGRNGKFVKETIYPNEREEDWNDDYHYIITAQDYNIREKLKRQLLCQGNYK